MKRELTIVIHHPDGRIQVHGDDLPDMTALIESVGEPTIEQELRQLGINTEINHHLCG